MSITVHISGGLGNQLFQYAAGRALALRTGTDLYLDTSSFLESGNLRSYMLDNYTIKAHILKKKNWIYQKIYNVIRSKFGLSPSGHIHAEKSNKFDPSVIQLKDGAYLLGHWQSEKYFADYSKLIKRELKLKAPLSLASRHMQNKMKKNISVAVHVRRGDYVSNVVAQEVLGTQSPEYYEKGARHIESKIKKVHFFVFSDDPIWARQNILTGYKSITYLETSAQPYEDLELIRSCDHFIIANSSFSWWGAWLGLKEGSLVIAPKKWFASYKYNSKDLIPKHWIQI